MKDLIESATQLLESIYIAPAKGYLRKIQPSDKKLLDEIFTSYFKGGKEKLVQSAEYFDSGYVGISFTLANSPELLIVMQPGRVGSDDQNGARLHFQAFGSANLQGKVSVGSNGKWGDVSFTPAHVAEAKSNFKTFVEKYTK
jgi:hypothetical protein